ncbi:hypothetical protein [Halomonas dongshanensis]|uniref:Uncharacterized protein n=1 Tax=Halomonas dongshanensis TaxID=2890835 RepID=A0ABT2EH32_9GAMM|nr:hypothetical protein [Halomonas dongshanensis]MCS2610889.1 hypothetical protein [Halomonas dongshanensis]
MPTEPLALSRISKSAIVEVAVITYLSGDSAYRREAAMSRRLDKLGRHPARRLSVMNLIDRLRLGHLLV